MARPSIYSQELADTICKRLAEGESLRSICRDDAMPTKSTVCKWLFDSDKRAFADQYARAREVQAELMAEEIVEISDDTSRDDIVDPLTLQVKPNNEWLARSRLRVDARKWVASKLLPKKYGDRVQQEVSGPNGGPVEGKVVFEFVRPEHKG